MNFFSDSFMQHTRIPILVFQICISVFMMSCFANIFAYIFVVSIIGGCGGGGARRRRVADSDESGSVGTSVGYRQQWTFGPIYSRSIVAIVESDYAEISRVLARVGINLKPNIFNKKSLEPCLVTNRFLFIQRPTPSREEGMRS